MTLTKFRAKRQLNHASFDQKMHRY